MEYGHSTGGNDQYGQGSTGGETAPLQIYQRIRELPDEALCESATAVLQLPEVWPPGQDLQVRGPDLQVLRGEARIDPVPGQRNTKVRKLWAGACHHQSPLPKETGSGTQSKNITNTITQRTHDQTIHQEPSPHPIEKRMGLSDHPRSSETALFRTIINSTMPKRRGTNGSNYQTPQTNGKGLSAKTSQNRKPEPVKVVSAPQQIPNAWTKPFVPSIMEFPLATAANRTKRSFSGPQDKQPRPVSRIQTKQQQNEEQMDDVLETIQIALSGATSLLRKISTGNTRLVPALKKIMEAAMDAINTLTV